MSTGLKNALVKKKKAIIKKWFDTVVDTYPPDTSRFIKSQKDPFANPVGNTTFHGLKALFDELVNGMDYETINSFLDPIIRIRAVQDFSPSKAIGFIFLLKKIIRESLKEASSGDEEYHMFDERIDKLGLIAFDIYVGCREKIYEIKSNEFKNRTFSAFERAGLIKEGKESQDVIQDKNPPTL
ncbi:RsbRD N-terminal domain-containing protein [Desulfococcaceae bacterium HSG8]|nr:RsbRD N-terminal domain-containing protein [Desulfococcaceae bacterium HSG8]